MIPFLQRQYFVFLLFAVPHLCTMLYIHAKYPTIMGWLALAAAITISCVAGLVAAWTNENMKF